MRRSVRPSRRGRRLISLSGHTLHHFHFRLGRPAAPAVHLSKLNERRNGIQTPIFIEMIGATGRSAQEGRQTLAPKINISLIYEMNNSVTEETLSPSTSEICIACRFCSDSEAFRSIEYFSFADAMRFVLIKNDSGSSAEREREREKKTRGRGI